MADRVITLANARRELEDMYSGVPDESVNLTFGDLADVKPSPLERKLSGSLETINEVNNNKSKNNAVVPVLSTLPSLDFSRALKATAKDHRAADADYRYNHPVMGHPFAEKYRVSPLHENQRQQIPFCGGAYNSKAYNDMNGMSMGASPATSSHHDQGKGRRPGIPHSNICTICSNYIYMCKHRCLVCGRAYCKNCGEIGMGEMTEGRKCVECLGKKFSHRYIQKAGRVSCFMRFRYSSEVIQQELKWAEKGPRKTGERRQGQSSRVSISRSSMTPRTPTRPNSNQGPPSFVMGSPYSPYNSSPINHALPL